LDLIFLKKVKNSKEVDNIDLYEKKYPVQNYSDDECMWEFICQIGLKKSKEYIYSKNTIKQKELLSYQEKESKLETEQKSNEENQSSENQIMPIISNAENILASQPKVMS